MNKEIGNVAGVSIMVSPEAYEEIKKQKTIYENEILSELQQRIDKAIEYNQKIYDTSTENERLMAKINLDILRGEDNEFKKSN